jgi:hypothetical protein
MKAKALFRSCGNLQAVSSRETCTGDQRSRPAGVRTPRSGKTGLPVLVWTYRF